MKTFWVLWTYSANYSTLHEVKAASAEEAKEKVTSFFSRDFHENGTTYVFDCPPVLVLKGKVRV